MDINVTALATTIVSLFLVPYIKDGLSAIGDTLKDKASEAVSNKASELTKTVWNKVASLFSSERDQATLKDFEESPDEAKALLEKKLASKLQENPEIARELDQLINQQTVGNSNSTGAQIMKAYTAGILDMRNSNLKDIHGGQIAGVIINNPKPSKDE